jgi:hypothetical protein
MTKKPAAEKAVSAVKAPRAVRPSATRTTTVRHKKSAVSSEPVVAAPAEPTVQAPQENAHEAISIIAYGYWAARGYQGGDATEDWCRAEAEYASRNAAL